MLQNRYQFVDGTFRFYTACFGSWAGDARIVFRVREDTTPKIRAKQKGIKNYDRLLPATKEEIDMWLEEHDDYKVLKVLNGNV